MEFETDSFPPKKSRQPQSPSIKGYSRRAI